MTEDVWRPLGVEADDAVASYDALHDGLTTWMASAYWAWVHQELVVIRTFPDGSGRLRMLNTSLAESMCQELQVALPNLRVDVSHTSGDYQFRQLAAAIQGQPHPLRFADYLLAHKEKTNSAGLEALLTRSKSVYTVGERAGRPGLVRRVPLGVQVALDDVIGRAGRAGARLAEAWGELYGLTPRPSTAYGLAIKAIEDVAIPLVSPKNNRATLGTVLDQLESQGDWVLPMDREHQDAPTKDVLIGMMRMIWHGQHDRHGGQPSAPGNVSLAEAAIAVGLAVTLVHWFDAGLVARK